MKRENIQLRILSGFAIMFVVLGHVSVGSDSFGTVFGLFYYCSFHLQIFLLISGYFFDETSSLKTFVGKKFRKLMIPYFAVYWGILFLHTQLQKLILGFQIGHSFTLRNALLGSFTQCQPVGFHAASWFVQMLFMSVVLLKLIYTLL